MPHVEVPGTRLHFEITGAGEPLLWISGFAVSSMIFTPILPGYARRFTCVTFDNRGSGRSAASWRPTSMPQLAADAVALLDALHIPSAHVYGLSMGGMVAQEMAIRFPDRVRGLILGGTSPGGPRSALPRIRSLAVRRPPVPEPPGAPGTRVPAHLVAAALFSPEFRRRHPDIVLGHLRLVAAHPATGRGLHAHWWAAVCHDATSRLHRITAPTLVLHGGRDVLSPPANARLLARLIPGAELALVPGAGHAYLLERPEEARRLLENWMDRHGPIEPGTPPRGLSARLEPWGRAWGLPLGAARTGLSLAALAGEQARRQRGNQPVR